LDDLRAHASSGARGMVWKGFGIGPGHDDFETLREEFLTRYEQRLAEQTTLFVGFDGLLPWLKLNDIRWGVVTNKHERFAVPLMKALGLFEPCSVLIGGDTTPHPKPHPAPCLEAARRLQLDPADCWFAGDDERDIIAGREAGMVTVATRYGYCGSAKPIEEWEADCVVDGVEDLQVAIEQALQDY
jgi:HAD superfamily hydrolase (TIGR01549 family)